MTYQEKRECADVLEKVASHRMGVGVRIRVNPNPDPRIAANEQAAYGLAKVDLKVKDSPVGT